MATKRKERNKANDSFWATAFSSYDEVKGWPKWKQSIIISSSSASTGRLIESRPVSKEK